MSDKGTMLDESIELWYNVRKGLIHEINVIPPARMTFRATLETRTIIELLQHVLEKAIVTVEELVREDTNFFRVSYKQLVDTHAPNVALADTQEKLINLLVEQYKDADQKLRGMGLLWMLQLVPDVHGNKRTRLAILHDTIGEEMYHRGQMTAYMRLLGLEPALTREYRSPNMSSDKHSR